MNAGLKVMNLCCGGDVFDGGKKFSPFVWELGGLAVRRWWLESGRVLEIFRCWCWVWKGQGGVSEWGENEGEGEGGRGFACLDLGQLCFACLPCVWV